MEEGFGADLSGVRVHDDARAAESARAVGAHAYAVGRDVVFAAGRYAPGTPAGDRLLAHELAHTLQDGAATLRRQPADDPFVLTPAGGDPRSLAGSVNFSGASRQEIQAEVEAIRRWLAAHPGAANEFHLRSELTRLEALITPPRWDAFAALFNREFAGVLNVLAVPGTPAGPVSSSRLRALFSETQRGKLEDFIATRKIPDRLFNGTDRGTTTAQQRLLLSAHILANGVYRPGSFDQRVHAQFCFHWVQIVHHYAGATPPGAGFAQGVMGTFDPLGAAALGTGKSVFIFHEKYVMKPDLPAEETPGGTGPLHEGTRHEEAARKAEAADPAKGASYHRQPSLPLDKFDQLQAGDWLWYYNANASGGGAHSVIFSHWEGATVKRPDGASYRVAVVWSQPSSRRGGVRHTARLGDWFVRNPANDMDPFVTPITHVSRVTPDSAPATTAAELVPSPVGKGATAVVTANDAFIKAKEAKQKGVLDRAKLKEWLREWNRGFIGLLRPHLATEQVQAFRGMNAGDDLEALVRLYQRLRPLSGYAVTLDANMASTYAKLDAEHVAIKAARAKTARDVVAVDAELKSVAGDTAVRESEAAGLDVEPRIKLLETQAAQLAAQIARMKPGPDRDALEEERQHWLDRARMARGTQTLRAGELGAVRTEVARLAARKRELDAKRVKLVKARDAAAATELPYGLVHPGSLGKADTRGTTGKLADLDRQPDWATMMTPLPAPSPGAAPKKP